LQGQRLREVAERREHDGDGGASDISEEEEIEEELGFISPLDTVNPYVTFKQALTGTFHPCLRPHPRFAKRLRVLT
jgi:importin-7